jgi:hypothetical protein
MGLRRNTTKFVSSLLSEEQKENLVSARHLIFGNLDVTDVQNMLHCYVLVDTARDIPFCGNL